MSAREEILRRVRAAAPGRDGCGVPVPRGYRRHSELARGDVIARFGERVAAGQAAVRHVAADELAVAMAAMLWAREAKRVAVPADLPRAWLTGLDGVRPLADDPPLDPAALAEMDGVVTGCALAIAETGTVVLDGGRGQGRRALTLIPRHHLCVVHADQIVGTVPEAVRRLDPYHPLSWISGPPEGRTLEILIVED
ncbi:LUD domain-containing protein [Actinomadura sp. DC4]|uniref:LutC/YkgG family protein n=1 Tax=Actinomadura sp. DC4 TaxID=3055069 RepID=UPI0025B17076|nr:LUD domain-containing protein [Actinomadura sp. DC4]MDN3359467.1 LUD domain-containing protein [Actinomadura sp. DC4]